MTEAAGSASEQLIDHQSSGPDGHHPLNPGAKAIIDEYSTREAAFRADREHLLQRQNRLANLRLLAAVVAIGAAIWILYGPSIPAAIVLFLATAAFVGLVISHRAASARRLRAEILAEINAEAVSRIHRKWDDLPSSNSVGPDAAHPFAADLDIFGHGSLFQLLDTTSTQMGSVSLESWLAKLAPLDEIELRQPAVQELAAEVSWRQKLQMLGRLNQSERRDPEGFFTWAEGDPILDRHWYLVWLARIGAVLTAVVAILALARVVEPAFIVVPILANLVLSYLAGQLIGDRIEVARNQHPAMKSYGELLEHLDTRSFQSPMLQDLLQKIGAHTQPAHAEVSRLGRITSFAVPKSAISHSALQAIANWDIHLLHFLEGWQRENGSQVRSWLEIAGQFEALSALGGLAHDNPDWAFADVSDRRDSIEGKQVGHPLIPATTRVSNDVTVGPSGTYLLVTGSNMSGKSTLLRSIGVNIVLASAGGPSCAQAFSMPPVALWTSVRVSDSLEQGISFYMAELLRLKEVHSAAEAAHAAGQPFCYLLDEILQGTNSAERQIAARYIIAALVELGAIGAVSTHDLELADSPEQAGSAVPVHFSDVFTDGPEGPVMSFDYHLRQGVATSTNALKLMQMVGFEMPAEAGRPRAERVEA